MAVKYPGKMMSWGTVLILIYWLAMAFLVVNLYNYNSNESKNGLVTGLLSSIQPTSVES
jgi:hypothetical protein